MKFLKLILSMSIFLLSFTISFADSQAVYSKIDEQILLAPPSAGDSTNEVIIYSNVREKTIHVAMNEQFDRIENMMFVNTVIELENGDIGFSEDECD